MCSRPAEFKEAGITAQVCAAVLRHATRRVA
jgi:hypothetical protein